jgi:hypothetical protein
MDLSSLEEKGGADSKDRLALSPMEFGVHLQWEVSQSADVLRSQAIAGAVRPVVLTFTLAAFFVADRAVPRGREEGGVLVPHLPVSLPPSSATSICLSSAFYFNLSPSMLPDL